VRYILFDTNYWKSFVRSRWRTPKGDPGALTLFGKRPDSQAMFAEHMVSEYAVRTEGRGRVVDEWQMRPNRTENHFWDCLVGCAVAASEQGIVLESFSGGKRKRERRKVKLSEIQRKSRGENR